MEQIVDSFTKFLLELVKEFVPTTWVHTKTSSHPWLSKASWIAITAKRSAEGTEDFIRLQQFCSEQVREDYEKYIETMKSRLNVSSNNPKEWWK